MFVVLAICLSVCLSVSLAVKLAVSLSVIMSVLKRNQLRDCHQVSGFLTERSFIGGYVCLSINLFSCLVVNLVDSLAVCLYVSLSVILSVWKRTQLRDCHQVSEWEAKILIF